VSNVLANLQQRRHKETELPSGLKVGYHLPDIQELILKVGIVPIPAVQHMQADEDISEEQALELLSTQPDAAAQGLRYTKLVVSAMLDDIDGETIEADDDRDAIVEALDQDDRQELFLIGTRQKDPDSGEA